MQGVLTSSTVTNAGTGNVSVPPSPVTDKVLLKLPDVV
ncbi:MAG: hypothetical protein CM15mP23_23070 [Cryomorphaceae bacterium]|nr:MAG: hypothetical protein CM15mP23_23070 [Cryomorphaceae bacterium]